MQREFWINNCQNNTNYILFLPKISIKIKMYYKIENSIHDVANVDNYRLLLATTLRNVLGTLTLGDILFQMESIAKEMKVMRSKSLTIFSEACASNQQAGYLPKHLKAPFLLNFLILYIFDFFFTLGNPR